MVVNDQKDFETLGTSMTWMKSIVTTEEPNRTGTQCSFYTLLKSTTKPRIDAWTYFLWTVPLRRYVGLVMNRGRMTVIALVWRSCLRGVALLRGCLIPLRSTGTWSWYEAFHLTASLGWEVSEGQTSLGRKHPQQMSTVGSWLCKTQHLLICCLFFHPTRWPSLSIHNHSSPFHPPFF